MKDIKVIKKTFTIMQGYDITHDGLPLKFQPHCPPGKVHYIFSFLLFDEISKLIKQSQSAIYSAP